MIITRLKGGLGNQMLQYARGRALSIRYNEPLKLDIESYKSQPSIDTYRQFALSPFAIQADIATEEEIRMVHYPYGIFSKIIENILKIFNKITGNFDIKSGKYLSGYWTNEKYFRKIRSTLLSDFSLQKPMGTEAQAISTKIKNSTSVSLHVRRGDFVTSIHAQKHNFHCGPEYYSAALKIITQEISTGPISLFVFSDDISWVKENMHSLFAGTTVVYVSNPQITDYEEIILMSQCKHHIIANSTFSWWGAWLGTDEDAINIAPKHWTVKNNDKMIKIIPSTWTQL